MRRYRVTRGTHLRRRHRPHAHDEGSTEGPRASALDRRRKHGHILGVGRSVGHRRRWAARIDLPTAALLLEVADGEACTLERVFERKGAAEEEGDPVRARIGVRGTRLRGGGQGCPTRLARPQVRDVVDLFCELAVPPDAVAREVSAHVAAWGHGLQVSASVRA